MALSNHELLIKLQQNCDPRLPATEQQRVPTEAARGIRPLVDIVRRELQTKTGDSRMQMPFAGHIGSGKSTELKHVILKLGEELGDQIAFVYVDVDDFLETLDVEPEDIYLGFVQVLAKEAQEQGVELKQSYWEDKLKEVGELLMSQIDPTELKTTTGLLTTTFRLQSTSRENRNKIRDRLRGKDDSLQSSVNELIRDFRVRVASRRQTQTVKVVIVFDSLERIESYRGRDRGAASFHQLFVEESKLFTDLDAHLILTMPIAHARSCTDQIIQRYSGRLRSMPSIKVTERDGKTPYPPGYEVFRRMFDERIDGTDRNAIIDEAALDSLIRYSGGYPRGFLNAVEEACRNAALDGDVLPIDEEIARGAFAPFVQNSVAAISKPQWRQLAELDLSDDNKINPEDPVVQALLRENLVFEYINGALSSGFDVHEPWYAIHPVIRELSTLKAEKKRVEEERDRSKGTRMDAG